MQPLADPDEIFCFFFLAPAVGWLLFHDFLAGKNEYFISWQFKPCFGPYIFLILIDDINYVFLCHPIHQREDYNKYLNIHNLHLPHSRTYCEFVLSNIENCFTIVHIHPEIKWLPWKNREDIFHTHIWFYRKITNNSASWASACQRNFPSHSFQSRKFKIVLTWSR